MKARNNGTTEKPASFAATYYSNGINRQAEVLSGFVLFEGIPAEDFATKCGDRLPARLFSQTRLCSSKGDHIRQVIFLTSDSVKSSQTGPSRLEVILRVVERGEFLCAECFTKYHHCSTTQTMQPSTALVWEVSQFDALAARFPALARNILCILLRTLNQLEVWFREVSTEKVETRPKQRIGPIGAPGWAGVGRAGSDRNFTAGLSPAHWNDAVFGKSYSGSAGRARDCQTTASRRSGSQYPRIGK